MDYLFSSRSSMDRLQRSSLICCRRLLCAPSHNRQKACFGPDKGKHLCWNKPELPCPPLLCLPSLDIVPNSVLCSSETPSCTWMSKNLTTLQLWSLVLGPTLVFPYLRLCFPTPGAVPWCFPTA